MFKLWKDENFDSENNKQAIAELRIHGFKA